MNVQIRAEAAQFPEKEYISGIAVAVGGTWVHTNAAESIFWLPKVFHLLPDGLVSSLKYLEVYHAVHSNI